jgi:hypothetical protein
MAGLFEPKLVCKSSRSMASREALWKCLMQRNKSLKSPVSEIKIQRADATEFLVEVIHALIDILKPRAKEVLVLVRGVYTFS